MNKHNGSSVKNPIGIDLGTTFCSVAVVEETGFPRIVMNRLGESITPSVIYFGGEKPVVGTEAKEMQELGDSEVASFFKRNMGDSNFLLRFQGKDYSAEALSEILLAELKAGAEASLGRSIAEAVITVPAYFNNFQREATIKAAEKAGLRVLRIINEPTAAAIAYGLDKRSGEQTVLVYDLGGGTFDVTIIRITPTENIVIATDGDHELGGKDWDDLIAGYLGQQFKDEHGLDPLEDQVSFNDLLVRCETGKKHLTSRDRVRISITHEGVREAYELTREKFEELTQYLMKRTQNVTEQVLKEAKLSWKQLDGVLLVGGSTRMPMVKRYVESMSGEAPLAGVNVDEAVALGAAIQASIDTAEATGLVLSGRKRTQDVMSHSLGMVAENEDRSMYINSIIIRKNESFPCAKRKKYQIHTNELEVYMLQGENNIPLQCVLLGKYLFEGIEQSPGKPSMVEVEYAYDANGVVAVSATDLATGKQLRRNIESFLPDVSWMGFPPEKEAQVTMQSSVVLSLDVSGSMRGAPIKEAKEAAREFLRKSNMAHTLISVVSFGDNATLACGLTGEEGEILAAIDGLNVRGQTDMAGGLELAYRELSDRVDPRYVVLLTDGKPHNAQRTGRIAKKICDEGIHLITIGTKGASESFLRKLACSDTNSYYAQSGEVVATFSKIAQIVSTEIVASEREVNRISLD